MVMVTGADAPAAVLTVTPAVPAVAIRLEGIAAINSVGLT
jgi:hypothetical protein